MGLSVEEVVSHSHDPATSDLETGNPPLFEMSPSKETTTPIELARYDAGMLHLQPTSASLDLEQQQLEVVIVVDNPPSMGKTPTKQKKHKSGSAKKPPKHPRAPRGLSLDSADQKIIKEFGQIARSKRARIERMKALMKMKDAKVPSSSRSQRLAILFTVLLCFVILLQGA